jgi:23S rRNA pseudoU1915 N3-methylase RlmH
VDEVIQGEPEAAPYPVVRLSSSSLTCVQDSKHKTGDAVSLALAEDSFLALAFGSGFWPSCACADGRELAGNGRLQIELVIGGCMGSIPAVKQEQNKFHLRSGVHAPREKTRDTTTRSRDR